MFILILFSSTLYAYNNPAIVRITNATGTDCVLEKHIPLYGVLAENESIPNVIFSDQTIVFTIKPNEEERRKAVLLSYACGDNRSITIFTDITSFQGMFISDGYVLKTNQIHTTFSEEHNETGHSGDKSAIEVHWRLTR